MNLPDLVRARRTWLTPSRLIVGGTVATAVAALAAMMSLGSDAGKTLITWVLLLQNGVLFFYGVPAAVNDFVEEHRNNTWDMLRLTPLTAAEMVLGRILASTSYAVFLAAVLAPWALFALTLPNAPDPSILAALWAALALGFVAAATTGIAGAALAVRIQSGQVGNAGLAMGGLGFIAAGYTQVLATSLESVTLGVGTVPGFLYFLLALGLWAAWGSVGAVRTVGKLLSERQKPWALPAFLATVWGYLALWEPAGRSPEAWSTLCITLPAVLSLLSSFAEGEGPEEWRTNFRSAGRERSLAPLLPGWAAPLSTVALLAGLTFAHRPEAGRIAAMAVFFLARDLCLLAALRVALRRNVEVAAAVLLGGLYILPVLYMGADGRIDSLFWLVPMEAARLSGLANVVPGALQAAVAAGVLWLSVRKARRGTELLR